MKKVEKYRFRENKIQVMEVTLGQGSGQASKWQLSYEKV